MQLYENVDSDSSEKVDRKTFFYFLPVEPNPLTPRSVISNISTSFNKG